VEERSGPRAPTREVRGGGAGGGGGGLYVYVIT